MPRTDHPPSADRPRRRPLGWPIGPWLLAGAALIFGCRDEGLPLEGDRPAADRGVAEAGSPDGAQPPDAGPLDGAQPTPDGALLPDAAARDDAGPPPGPPVYRLTLLHTHDGDSALLTDDDEGGIARLVTAMARLDVEAAEGPGRGRVLLSAGDTFEAGPVFGASLQGGLPHYPVRAMNRMGYDAVALGTHEFDFGPDILADFLVGFDPPVPALGANLEWQDHPGLSELADQGRLVRSTVVETGGERVGVVGAVATHIHIVSSPGPVRAVDPAPAVSAEVERLRADGVDKIVLLTHLADTDAEAALVRAVPGVDIIVSGADDPLLGPEGARVHAGDAVVDPYPRLVPGADGPVLWVSAPGDYRYIGRLVVDFDADGRVTAVDATSGPVRVIGGDAPDAVAPDPVIVAEVVEPVEAALADLAAEQIGFSEVPLQGRRRDLRRRETNLGALVADAMLWAADDALFGTDAPRPQVALINGGAIRNNSIIPPGRLSALNTYEILPFASFVTLVEVDVPTLRLLLENAVSRVDESDGRFAQVAGLRFTWDPDRPARAFDPDGTLIEPGQRVVDAWLADGTPLVADGGVVGEGTIIVATIDFLARGGDGYPFPEGLRALGISYQQALRDYIAGALEGEVTAGAYPVGGEGRIEVRE